MRKLLIIFALLAAATAQNVRVDNLSARGPRPWVDVTAYGARGDGQYISNGVTNGTSTITSSSALFSSATDIGKVAICVGCGTNAANLLTTVSSVTNSTTMVLASTAALKLPILLTGSNCSATPTGYITVANTGVPNASGTIVANGTSTCTVAPTCTMVAPSTQSGTGVACTATVAAGVVNAINVTGGTGYFASFIWGHNDATAIASAATAAKAGTLFFPDPPKDLYLMQSRLLLDSTYSGIQIRGVGYSSWIAGDPGDTAFLEMQSTAQAEITGLRFSDVHRNAANTTDNSYVDIYLNPATDVSVHHNWFTNGRTAVQMYKNVKRINVSDNFMSGMTDGAVWGVGLDASNYPDTVTVSRNIILPSVTSGMNGPPHQLNLEDLSNTLIEENQIQMDTGFIESGASCIQVFPNHTTGAASIDHVLLRSNICRRSTAGTNKGILMSASSTQGFQDVSILGNIVDGFQYGISVQHINTGNGNVKRMRIENNSVSSSTYRGIDVYGDALVDPDLAINNNTITDTSGDVGMHLTLMRGISVQNNRVGNNQQHGIQGDGIQRSLFSNNLLFSNGTSSANTYDGLQLIANGGTLPDDNMITNNDANDFQGSTTQRYGINLAASVGSYVYGNWGNGNQTALILNSTSTPIWNVGSVTANANVTTDQNLQAAQLKATLLNYIGRTIQVFGGGTYTSATTGTLIFKVKMCTVSGCGSGTVITLNTYGPTVAMTNPATSMPWNINMTCTTVAVGTSGTMMCNGNLSVVMGATATAAGAVHVAQITGTSTVDLTVQEFMQVTVSSNAASASNTFTQRQMMALPVN